MSVHYKFKSTLDYDTVSFDGLHISVGDLKKAIFHQKRIGKNTDFDLQITNAQTKEDYNDDNALIAKNTSLIVARVPLTIQQKRSWDRSEAVPLGNSKEETALGRAVDLTRLDGSEGDKIRAMMTQSTQDYDPSNYMKIRGANQTGEVPTNYRCFRCHQPGHWIKNCPLGSNQEPIEIKKSTGIPRSFMVPVDGPSVPGAMMTPTGHYAVPVIDHQAYKEGKKERPPFSQDPDPVVEKPEIPDDLLCNICKDLMTDAVMIPCCGNSFCDECIRTFLLESEDHECPDCADKDNSPETLIPNRFLRNAVSNFKNETGYAKRPIFRPPKIQPEVPAESGKAEVATVLSQEKAPSQSDVSTLSQESVEKSPTQAEVPVKTLKPALSTMIAESASAAAAASASASASTPTPTPAAPASTPTSESEVQNESSTKLHTDEESEVPPPPGTEPLLPIPSAPEAQDHDKKEVEEEYPRERHHRERRRSYSRDTHRDRQSHHGDYQGGGSGSHMINQSHSKSYSNHPGSDGHYQHHMHYDSGIRRSTEDRAGTPTVDEPHLHPPPAANQPPLLPFPPGDERVPTTGYNPPPPNMVPHNPPLLPDPYMGHRVPMYPHQQQGPQYPPPPRYERPPYSQYGGARSAPPPRGYNGPPRPARGMMNPGYRGIQPPPPGLGRNIHNGGQGVIDDPLEAFERMLREKDERDRRMGKHRRRTRSRSRSRSYTRSRSRSFGRRSPRISRSRTPPPKRRSSRSPPPLRRSRTPMKRRSRSGSFSMSRSRSFSRSQSPRGSIPRDRERDRDRDAPPRYRSPARSPPRFHRDRERERDRPKSRETREPFNTYYNDPPNQDYQFRERDRDLPPRDRPLPHRYPPRNQVQHNAPSMMPPIGAGGHPPIMPMGHPPQDRKDYYDSYNRYPSGPPPARYNNSPHREHTHKRFDDVAPPGTEGYYDLPPPGVDHLERPTDRSHAPRDPASKNQETEERERGPPREERVRDREDRARERDDRAPLVKEREDRNREKDDRERRGDKERDEKLSRRDDERQFEKRDYEKDRFRDERGHRMEDKGRVRERDRERRERDYERDKDRERHERYEKQFADRKKKRTPSPYVSKSRSELKDTSPERSRKKDRDYEDKPEEKKKEKKIKDKKKKKDSDEKEKKKKKKKEKKLIQKEALKEEQAKAIEVTTDEVKTEEEKAAEASALLKVENIKPEETQETPVSNETNVASVEEFEEKSLAINPEPPESTISTSPKIEESEPGANPPNPNFKPIPELKAEKDIKTIDSLYSGLDDAEINTVITEKYAILENEIEVEAPKDETVEIVKSPKKDEFLAPVPEISKWERDENIEKTERENESDEKRENDESKDNKVVTSEVLKRAENAIFQKAINAIRPIEIKKISESRKILYQNPEPKILEVEPPREQRKSVNVTINVGKNERNVEISEPVKKAKLDRSKFKPVPESHSPTRLSAKERLGDKVEDEKERKPSPKPKIEPRSPRLRERRLSPIDDKRLEPVSINPERKVFLEERKRIERPKERNREEMRNRQEMREARIDTRPDLRTDLRAAKIERERERDRTPPIIFRKIDIPKPKKEDEDKEKEKRKEKKREEKKRKKEHRSRSKSKDRKKKKDKKHKKEKHLEKKQKHKEKIPPEKVENELTENSEPPAVAEETKKQRKNPRLVSDRKRSVLDEANFEPDYSATESESETEEKVVPVKKVKLDDAQVVKEPDNKLKKRVKSISSDEESSSTESTSSESESSDESHKKRKKKHKKHKKKKSVKKESSSDSDSYSDSSDSSSEEERHRKKSKKFKKSKQKKKKKSKHK